MVTVVNHGVFGGGIYSTAHSQKLKMVGNKRIVPTEIRIRKFRAYEKKQGKLGPQPFPFYVPKSASEEFHPGGNSLCFTIQLAHVMGCYPIICSGFTFQSGSNYWWGDPINPATRVRSLYRSDLALAWLACYESAFPGRVLLDPLFDGPVYSVLRKASEYEIQAAARNGTPNDSRYESDKADQSVREV